MITAIHYDIVRWTSIFHNTEKTLKTTRNVERILNDELHKQHSQDIKIDKNCQTASHQKMKKLEISIRKAEK